MTTAGAPLGAETDLEAALDALFGTELDQFIPGRDALVRTLRQRKQAELARSVQRLRKPSLSAWVTNRLVREAPAEVAQLLDRGAALRQAQQQALDGSRAAAGELRSLAGAEREVVGVLVRRGAALLTAGGHAAADVTLDRVAQSLHTAATTTAGARLLRQGRLERDLDVAGFGDLEAEEQLEDSEEPAKPQEPAVPLEAAGGHEPPTEAEEALPVAMAGAQSDQREREAAQRAEDLEAARRAGEAAVAAARAAEGEAAERRQAEAAARARAEELGTTAASIGRLAEEAARAAAAAEADADRARVELEAAEAASVAARAHADEVLAALAPTGETG